MKKLIPPTAEQLQEPLHMTTAEVHRVWNYAVAAMDAYRKAHPKTRPLEMVDAATRVAFSFMLSAIRWNGATWEQIRPLEPEVQELVRDCLGENKPTE